MKVPFLILACVFLLFACGKSDKENPNIFVTAPVTGKVYRIMDTINYDLTFVDNKELDNYQISVNHTESFVRENPFGNIIAPFTATASGSLNTNTIFINNNFVIDQPVAAGNYSLLVTAVDKEGNANFKTVPFLIRNQFDTIAPVIDSIKIPAENTAVPVSFSTTLRDDQQLATIQYFIVRQSTLDTILYRYFTLSDTMHNFNDTFSVANGSYRLRLKVRDAVNNQIDSEATFIIQ